MGRELKVCKERVEQKEEGGVKDVVATHCYNDGLTPKRHQSSSRLDHRGHTQLNHLLETLLKENAREREK